MEKRILLRDVIQKDMSTERGSTRVKNMENENYMSPNREYIVNLS